MLQTNWEPWLPAIEDEVRSLLDVKEAFRSIAKREMLEMIKDAEKKGRKVTISKMFFTKKPGP